MPGRDLAQYVVSKLVFENDFDVHGNQASRFTQTALPNGHDDRRAPLGAASQAFGRCNPTLSAL